MSTAKIRKCNQANLPTLAPSLPLSLHLPNSTSYTIHLLTPSHLSPSARDTLYSLFNDNIGPLGRGTSMEHDEDEKRDEMFEPTTRILVALRDRVGGPNVEGSSGGGGGGGGKGEGRDQAGHESQAWQSERVKEDLIGFCSFRFDTEETADDDYMAEVIYCYEVQLVPSARGQGLGQRLMGEMESIGRRMGMEKAMLTCLRNNTGALKFYEKCGYVYDEIDPIIYGASQGLADADGDDIDYRIMSRPFT